MQLTVTNSGSPSPPPKPPDLSLPPSSDVNSPPPKPADPPDPHPQSCKPVPLLFLPATSRRRTQPSLRQISSSNSFRFTLLWRPNHKFDCSSSRLATLFGESTGLSVFSLSLSLWSLNLLVFEAWFGTHPWSVSLALLDKVKTLASVTSVLKLSVCGVIRSWWNIRLVAAVFGLLDLFCDPLSWYHLIFYGSSVLKQSPRSQLAFKYGESLDFSSLLLHQHRRTCRFSSVVPLGSVGDGTRSLGAIRLELCGASGFLCDGSRLQFIWRGILVLCSHQIETLVCGSLGLA